MKQFETVAKLKLSKLTAGQTVSTKGYYASGDGGGASYLVVPAKAVDGYGDHVLANSEVAEIQSTNSINLLQYGAKGDSSTDDSAALQAALNAALGRELRVTATGGSYNLESTIVLPAGTNLVMDRVAQFKRASTQTVMFLNGDVGGSYPGRTANSDITWIGGVVQLNGIASTQATAMAFAQATDIRVEDVDFTNCRDAHFIEINGVARASIQNCTFTTMTDSGTRAFSEAIQLDAMFNSIVFPYFGGTSFDDATCRDIRISGCTFTDCLVSIGSHTFVSYGDGTVATAHSNISISDITIVNAGNSGSVSDAINAEGWFNFSIDNVTIEGAGNNGIRCDDCQNFTINNVTASNVDGNAVFLVKNTWALDNACVSNISVRTGLDIVNLYKCSNITVSCLNGFNIRYGLHFAACDDITFTGVQAESAQKLIQCSLSEARSSRLSGSGLSARLTSLECIFLYAADSTIYGGVLSVPAAGQTNVIIHGCSSTAVGGMFCNGASVAQSFNVTASSVDCVVESSRNAGTGVAGVVIDSGCNGTLLQSLYLKGPSVVTDNGTGTIQHNIN